MRELIATVYELADIGITVIPVKSQNGPITSTMGYDRLRPLVIFHLREPRLKSSISPALARATGTRPPEVARRGCP
jgi:hypothetical protein